MIIKLKDILKEIQWLTKSYDLAAKYYFPFTPEVVKIFPGEKIPVPINTEKTYNIVDNFIKTRQ
jgi:hypothetical protein